MALSSSLQTKIWSGSALNALDVIAELWQELASSVDLDVTLTKAVQRIAEEMQAEAASLFMLDGSTGDLVCRFCAGPVDIRGLRLPLESGVLGRAMASGVCQMVSDTRFDADFDGRVDAQTGFVTRSLLCAPLGSEQEPVGVLQVLNKRGDARFDESDRLLLRALVAPAALVISNTRLVAESIEKDRLHRELTMARRMQRSLLPKRRRGDFPILAINRPAQEISGDFYDYFLLADGRIGFSIGDVAGKGLDAAFLMVRCASLIRWAGKEGIAPGLWMARVNEELCETLSNGSFVCAVVGYLDPKTRRVVWANAGFPPVIQYRRGSSCEIFRAEAPPLGILPGLSFPEQSSTIDDADLYLLSDGATDARDADRKLLGMSGVQDLITTYSSWRPETRLRRIMGEIRRMSLTDDTTIMLIKGGESERQASARP